MNPDHTIRTGAAGRRAAAIRDGRAEAGDATTQVLARGHSAGPWRFADRRLNQVGQVADAAGVEVAVLSCRLRPDGEIAYDEIAANQALIAAAPRLLALCRKAAEVIAGIPNAYDSDLVLAAEMRAAVAEAEVRA